LFENGENLLQKVEAIALHVRRASDFDLDVSTPLQRDQALEQPRAKFGAVQPLIQVHVGVPGALRGAPKLHLDAREQTGEQVGRGAHRRPHSVAAVHTIHVAWVRWVPQAVDRLHEVQTRELILNLTIVVTLKKIYQRLNNISEITIIKQIY
jgi:hypothetical protein